MTTTKLVPILALVGCSAIAETQSARLGDLVFNVPDGWAHHDGNTRHQISTEWLPSSNERKESLEVIQTEVSASVVRSGQAGIRDLLDRAQPVGDRAKVVSRSALTSQFGLVGAQIELDFVPPGTAQTYRRIHAVLIDGNKLIHVIYTAQDPEADAASIVVSSIHHEGA